MAKRVYFMRYFSHYMMLEPIVGTRVGYLMRASNSIGTERVSVYHAIPKHILVTINDYYPENADNSCTDLRSGWDGD